MLNFSYRSFQDLCALTLIHTCHKYSGIDVANAPVVATDAAARAVGDEGDDGEPIAAGADAAA